MRARLLVLVSLVSFVSLASAPAAARKVGVLPLEAGAGVDEKVAAAVTDAVAGQLAKTGVEVMTERQLKALLDNAAQKALAGCSDDACMAQIGEALGVDALVNGSLAKVGTSWLVALRMVETSTGKGALADRRLKGGKLDDVLDALPVLVQELAGAPAVPAASGAGASASAGPAAIVGALPAGAKLAGGADVPAKVDAAVRARLKAAGDGKGLVVLWDPAAEDTLGTFWVSHNGAAGPFYAQRVYGGSREGEVKRDAVFWDPRAKAPWQAGFGVDENGKPWLQCGDNKIALWPGATPKDAKLHDVRWQRRLVAVARADDGTYFVVDQARAPEDNRDYRLHVGKPGAFASFPVSDAVVDAGTQLYATSAGQLALVPDATWAPAANGRAASAKVSVRVLDVEQAARDVYGRLGVYAEPLGTPCDRYLGAAK